jgi:hypothetical protein
MSSVIRGWVCRLQLLLVLASAVTLGSQSRGTHILLSQIRDSPNLKGQVPVFIPPRKSVVQLYSQSLGSLFVASYEIFEPASTRTLSFQEQLINLYNFEEDRRENTVPDIWMHLFLCGPYFVKGK